MTTTAPRTAAPAATPTPGVRTGGGPRVGRRPAPDPQDRGVLSPFDRRRPPVRAGMTVVNVALFVLLVFACLGPLLLLMKFAITPTQDILRTPLAVFPNGVRWENLSQAWNEVHIDRYFLNTVVLAAGSWFFQLLVATTGGFVISVLRPRYAPLLNALVIATLFVPGVVLLVPLYLTVLNPPLIGQSLLNTVWAVWLPSAASAFNVVIVARFFDSLPREIFEAARVDGAGPLRLFVSVVLPMSKPILGVVSVFAVIASWKDFLWPMLVLKQPDLQPLSVRLPAIQAQTDLGVFLAALAISTIVPLVVFVLFQRLFLRGAGMSGAVKG
ncbi:MAG: carbohydrate ABC transporter permease [Propionicimonas sp.]|nr:carbohydrate ABC transporter permease [Propionicimonas sp.]